MTPTKLLVGHILIVFAVVIARVWLATEWCTTKLSFEPPLGRPWFKVQGLPVYRPRQLFESLFWCDANRGGKRPSRLRHRDRRLAVAGAAEPARDHL